MTGEALFERVAGTAVAGCWWWCVGDGLATTAVAGTYAVGVDTAGVGVIEGGNGSSTATTFVCNSAVVFIMVIAIDGSGVIAVTDATGDDCCCFR